MPNRRKDLGGKVIGRLTVLHAAEARGPRGDILWWVRCSCGKQFIKKSAELGRKQTAREGQAEQSCGCARQSKRVYVSKYESAGHITGHHFGRLQGQARHRGHHFAISAGLLWEKFIQQKCLCALSGVPLAMSEKNAVPGEAIASLDRIDSGKGYVRDNVQWVHPTVNFMKHAMRQEHFIEWCRKIAEHY